MEFLYLIVLSISSILILFIISKLLGNREISHLSMFDYINSITIGSIAAEMATSSIEDFYKPAVAMLVYGGIVFLISFVSNKSIRVRRFAVGKPRILLNNGKIYEEALKKSKLNINEFLTQLRVKGYFNISDIETAIIETSGKLSVLPKANKKPVAIEDMNISAKQERSLANVIIDGKIMSKNLQYMGFEEKWLKAQIKKQGFETIEEILLATLDDDGNVSVYEKIIKTEKHDIFQ